MSFRHGGGCVRATGRKDIHEPVSHDDRFPPEQAHACRFTRQLIGKAMTAKENTLNEVRGWLVLDADGNELHVLRSQLREERCHPDVDDGDAQSRLGEVQGRPGSSMGILRRPFT